MDKPLSGKTALVTGSGRGLGNAMAHRLAELGANVAIHDLSETACSQYGEANHISEVLSKFSGYGVKTAAVTGDLADPATAPRMAAEVEKALGPISVLVNCAGGDIGAKGTKPNPNDALHIALEDIRRLIDSNLIGTILVCQAVCPGMVERKQGSVINIASVAAHFGTSPEVVYSSIKAAIVHFTRCLAFELRPHGVRVNAVSPGPTKTARFVSTRKVDPEMMKEEGSLIRYANPSEIADAVAFLAGDGARFVNGQIIRVDGGMTLYAG